MNKRISALFAVGAIATLALAGCAGDGGGSAKSDKDVEIGFFGFAASNSFAQGTFKGVEKAAKEEGAKATFIDGQFDGQLQAQQINDAITSKRYSVIVIQANDNLAVQEPLERAVEAGISVVVEFVPVGPKFDTIDPQVKGAISVVDAPIANGEELGKLAQQACEKVTGTCKVAYMEGSPALPLDNARTKAVLGELEGKKNITVLPTVTGGYTPDDGRKAFQDISQANPDVNVVIGSTQALAGAWDASGENAKIHFIGNGGSRAAVAHVRDGEWFAIWALDVVKNGYTAAKYGIEHHQGKTVEMATDERSLAPNEAIGTKEALDAANFEGGYDD